MRTLLSFCVLLLSGHIICGQILNQDAKGNSTILAKGGTIGIDIKDASIRINHYYLPLTGKGLVMGLDLQGANSEGISTLLTNEGIEPEGRGSLVVGFEIGKARFKDSEIEEMNKRLKVKKDSLLDELEQKVPAAERRFEDLVNTRITAPCNSEWSKMPSLIKDLKRTFGWKNKDKAILEKAEAWQEKAHNDGVECEALFQQIRALAIEVRGIQDFVTLAQIEDELAVVDEELEDLPADNSSIVALFIPYLRAAGTATEFTQDLGIDSITFDSRFLDTLRTHLSIEGGVSASINTWRFGLTGGFMRFDNFSELKKKSFKYVEMDTTITSGSLSRSKDFTAYSGSYERFGQIIINWDVMKLLKIQDTIYGGLSLYGRASFPLENSDNIPDPAIILGIGINYFNMKATKFLGGAYLQTNDLFGSSGKPFYQKLQFGLTARIAFSGVKLE